MESIVSCLGRPRLNSERDTGFHSSEESAKAIVFRTCGRRAKRKESETNIGLEDAKRQKSEQLELPLEYRGEALKVLWSVEALTAANEDERSSDERLMEKVVEEGNVKAAIKRVRQNKGSAGIDGMSVEELPGYMAGNWERIRSKLLAGTYRPEPVKRVDIPKASGGVRQLGIPTVVDRMIQQMVLNVLQPKFDPTFSEHSYGFRPGRNAHQAVTEAQRYLYKKGGVGL